MTHFRLPCGYACLLALTFLLGCGGSSHPAQLFGSVAPTANPLVASYTFFSACSGPAMVEFGETGYERATAWYQAPGHYVPFNILVAGMKPSTTYTMRSVLQCEGTTVTSEAKTFTTGPLPSLPFPSTHVTRPNPNVGVESAGIELITAIGQVGSLNCYYTDRNGNVIWYYDPGSANGELPSLMKLLPNGHMLFTVSHNGVSDEMREIDLAGNTIRKMTIAQLVANMQTAGFNFSPTNIHHDLLPLDNNHLILLTNFNQTFSGGTTAVVDGLVDLDENWNPVWAWNAADYLDINRHPFFPLPDWTHGNAVIYSPGDGNLVFSARAQSWIMKIDYANGAGTGSILWKLGYQGDFALSQGTDPTLWFYSQHFPSLTAQSGSQMDLTIWDNGNNRVLDSNGTLCTTNCYSRATRFQIDESTHVADLVWQDTPGFFSIWGGSISQLANGNVEFDLNAPSVPPVANSVAEIQEVTQTAVPQVIWQMDFDSPSNAYRAYRVPSLYPGVTWPN
jgi:arylsulfate sulfotransferase